MATLNKCNIQGGKVTDRQTSGGDSTDSSIGRCEK